MYKQTSLLDVTSNPKLKVMRADVRNESLMKELASKADVIIPLACLTGAPLCDRDPTGAQMINRDAVHTFLKHKSKNQMMIFPSTNSGYGIGAPGKACDESSPLTPVSLYGRLKVEIENLLLADGGIVTFRFATLFGSSPRMRLDLLVNDFVYRAVFDRFVVLFEPHFKRNYLHVRDGARAFIHVMENYDRMKGNAFNVGLSSANLSKLELCQRIKAEIPDFQFPEAEVGEDPDKRNYIVSNDKIESTGFRTLFNLEQGIKELKNAYQVIKRNEYANI
jgi:nucleoside-diphosphate-sugar epimerase